MKKLIIFIILLAFIGCSSISMRNRYISRHFTLKEATYSYTAKKYGIKNIPNNDEFENILYTARRMEQVRRALKSPIYITSWFRNSKVNRKVNGSRHSYHRKGLAVDFRIKGNAKYIRYRLKKARVSYDQLIYYPRQNRVHISFKRARWRERKQYFIKYR